MLRFPIFHCRFHAENYCEKVAITSTSDLKYYAFSTLINMKILFLFPSTWDYVILAATIGLNQTITNNKVLLRIVGNLVRERWVYWLSL